ncbi:alanine--tRNA ligase [Candidatus Micrarchaeota archaeon CG_4_10_14_0_2_um_filter_49_7]|nr:MAG: alanine--tRNA ligase [Candidatus Micrarchaeota archaeon CG1_02_49_24]PIZ98982.1 MAG: alanine--tRNA ligase [Candidatus Micrarchaeota archaeon CG_4_10_14_0_2_um_filter_49_7]
MLSKGELRKQFSQDWQKHYDLDVLKTNGFTRKQCSSCKKNFWSVGDRDKCGDPSCIGYEFIGNPPSQLKLTYADTWKKVKGYFTSNGHTYVKPYPTVARWRDDLYFTIASINDFQPYVVSGELEPIANPLVVPQPCIRFGDITNVGVTGRHYTNFVMVGQHAFNSEKTGLFYWKNEALGHDINLLKSLGLNLEEIIFIEDVWLGGGNYGPCIEYFSRGLELGNCVFMQYEILPDQSSRELRTKVIDMGAGLERLAWITHGSPTSYEIVFGNVIAEMKKWAGVGVEDALFLKYAKGSGMLNAEEVGDMKKAKEQVAREIGVPKEELFKRFERLFALYACADHMKTVLMTTSDGMLPSNVGGGYNLRMILRRSFGFDEDLGLRLDYGKILKMHAEEVRDIFPQYLDGVDSAIAVVEEERRKFGESKKKASGRVAQIIEKAKKTGSSFSIPTPELVTLYQSYGIPIEVIEEVAKKENINLHLPPASSFYKLARHEDELVEARKEEHELIDVSQYPQTKNLSYENLFRFKAKVLGIEGTGGKTSFLILDQSAFYAEGGGQTSDTGTINGISVVDVKNSAGIFLHKMAKAVDSTPGTEVECVVEREKRAHTMRHHSGAHVLQIAARAVLGRHVWQAGAHKSAEKAHLDLTHYKHIPDEELARIERLANEIIVQNIAVKKEILPRNVAESQYGFGLYQGGACPGKELRVVSIGELDHEACGGIHVERTGDIGCFKIIKRESIQDGIERITYKCGVKAIEYMQSLERSIRDSSALLSVSTDQLPQSVERFFSEWKEQRKQIEVLSGIVANSLIDMMKENELHTVKNKLDLPLARKVAELVTRSQKNISLVLIAGPTILVACSPSSGKDANALLQEYFKKSPGKGGGTKLLASGKLNL